MRAFKSIILIGLLFAGLVMQGRAQVAGDKIRYHWITENEVILWKSPGDANPVKASLDPEKLRWTVPPVEVAGTSWQSTLSAVVRQYSPAFDTKKLTYEQLWAFVLTKLRNEYGAVAWAKPRDPSVEIYLGQKADNSLQVFVNYKAEGDAVKQAKAVFTLKGRRWVWDNPLPVENILGIKSQSPELRKMLGLSENEKLPDGQDTWGQTWNKVANNLASAPRIRSAMYTDAKGTPQWLWIEKWTQEQNPPAASRQMPAAPALITEPKLSDEQDNGSGQTPTEPQTDWLKWTIVAAVVLLLLTLGYFFGFRRYWPSVRDRAGKLVASFRRGTGGDSTSGGAGQPVLVTAETLKRLHVLVKERLSPPIQGVSANKEGFPGMLEWIHAEYLAEAKSSEFLQEAEAQWNEHLRKFLQEVGVKQGEDNHLKKWVDLGRGVELAARSVNNGLIIPGEVREQISVTFADEQPSQEELAANWPAVLSAYRKCLQQRTEAYEALELRFKEAGQQHALAITDKETNVEKRWKGQVETLTGQKTTLDKQLKESEKKLKTSTETITKLEGRIQTLESKLREAEEAAETEREKLSPLQTKLSDIQKVQRLSSYLRKWLQGYFVAQMKEDNEIRSVAVVATLLNFSLNQMCFSIVKEQDQLRTAMADNISRLSKVFEQQSGGAANVNDVHQCIADIVPEAKETMEQIKKDKMKGDALDAHLFQVFLTRLKTDTGKNLSPLFIEMDAGENKLVRVSVS